MSLDAGQRQEATVDKELEQKEPVSVLVAKVKPEQRDLVKEVKEEAKKHFPGLTDEEIENFL